MELTVNWQDLQVGDQILKCNYATWGSGYVVQAVQPSLTEGYFFLGTAGWEGLAQYREENVWVVFRPVKVAAPVGRFPHKCPKCAAPAYIGFSSVECSKCPAVTGC